MNHLNKVTIFNLFICLFFIKIYFLVKNNTCFMLCIYNTIIQIFNKTANSNSHSVATLIASFLLILPLPATFCACVYQHFRKVNKNAVFYRHFI